MVCCAKVFWRPSAHNPVGARCWSTGTELFFVRECFDELLEGGGGSCSSVLSSAVTCGSLLEFGRSL